MLKNIRRAVSTAFAPFVAVALLSGTALAQPAGTPPTPVTVVTLKGEDVTLTSSLPGRVLASAEAEVRPQVNGIVTERLFSEGSQVEAGELLYRIDRTTYEAAVAQAEAAVAQAKAQAEAARREATRVDALRDRNVASEQTQDTAIANRDAADAALKVAEAQLRSAQIDLERTDIRAQLTGEIGLAQSSQGVLVTASQIAPLAVIRQIDPVYVDVTQSAAEMIRWRRGDEASKLDHDFDRTVTLILADGSKYEETGTLTAAEPYVNETTGVITLRMEFANPNKVLLPGMYVLAVIPQAIAKDVVLAPQEGVTRDRRGRPIALVVNDQNVVEERQLTILQDRGNQWIVSDGLKAGDRIVVEGLQRITAGVTVAPEERAAPAAEAGQGDAAASEADAAPAE